MYRNEAELALRPPPGRPATLATKESTVDKSEDRRTAQSAEETAGSNHIRKSPSLRLDKQVIRTLTGAELKVVAGALCYPGGSIPFSLRLGCEETH
jgi:hypothetical protein